MIKPGEEEEVNEILTKLSRESFKLGMKSSEELLKAAQELLDSVSFDENGELMGGKWIGGHGGLISQKTGVKADTLRRVIDKIKRAS